MTRKQRRIWAFALGGALVAGAVALVLSALGDNLVFFHSPGDVNARAVPPGQKIRVGGLVVEGSLRQQSGRAGVRFAVTDLEHSIDVVYDGLLPDLFREGQGVIAEGALDREGVFQADEILAKHDENYMPPEVAESLKAQGVWRNGEKQAGPVSAAPGPATEMKSP